MPGWVRSVLSAAAAAAAAAAGTTAAAAAAAAPSILGVAAAHVLALTRGPCCCSLHTCAVTALGCFFSVATLVLLFQPVAEE